MDNSQNTDLSQLLAFLNKIPSIDSGVASGLENTGNWWVKFKIDIEHPLAWNVVQEIGFVANYISLNERLPTKFYPVSAPPYLNGGPKTFLYWVIENSDTEFTPNDLAEWLESRLPNPVDDLSEWERNEEEDDDE